MAHKGMATTQMLEGRRVRLTESQWAALDAEATRKNIGKSEILRRVVDEHLFGKAKATRVDDRLRRLEERMAHIEREQIGGQGGGE